MTPRGRIHVAPFSCSPLLHETFELGFGAPSSLHLTGVPSWSRPVPSHGFKRHLCADRGPACGPLPPPRSSRPVAPALGGTPAGPPAARARHLCSAVPLVPTLESSPLSPSLLGTNPTSQADRAHGASPFKLPLHCEATCVPRLTITIAAYSSSSAERLKNLSPFTSSSGFPMKKPSDVKLLIMRLSTPVATLEHGHPYFNTQLQLLNCH